MKEKGSHKPSANLAQKISYFDEHPENSGSDFFFLPLISLFADKLLNDTFLVVD